MGRRKKSLGYRVGLIDELRGLAIILMVVYHLFFDLVYIFGVKIDLFSSVQVDLLRDIFAGLFIFISGTACRMSKNNLKRGVICFGLGMALTLITWFIMPREIICFGILHMLGISMILYHLIQRVLDKLRFPIIGIIVSGVLFWFTFSVSAGRLGPWTLPDWITSQNWLFPLGITTPGFSSSDYFPLLPWLFVFIAGTYFGVYVVENRLPLFFYKTHIRLLAYVGRHTLVIYLLHQPVVYGVLYVVFNYIIPLLTQQPVGL